MEIYFVKFGKEAIEKVIALRDDFDSFKKDCQNEVEIMHKLSDSPFCAKYYAHKFDEKHKTCTLTMKRYACDLADYLKRTSSNELSKQKLTLVIRAIQCLDVVHSFKDESVPHGYLHRDVKCRNFLVTETNELVIADFGLAKARQSCSTVKNDGTVEVGAAHSNPAGTYSYCSPEILQLLANDINIKTAYCRYSDIYSLGLVIGAILTGKEPYCWCKSDLSVATNIQQQKAPFINFYEQDHPKVLYKMIEWCCEQTPTNRPRSCKQLLAVLNEPNETGAMQVMAQIKSENQPAKPDPMSE